MSAYNNLQNYPTYPLQSASSVQFPDFRSVDISASEQVEIFDQYWEQIHRHLALILVLFFTVELLTLLFVLTATPLYTSSSTVVIENQMPEVLERNTARDDSDGFDQSFYSTQWRILESRTLAARVIRDLKLQNDPAFIGPPEKPALVTRVLSWIRSLLSTAHRGSNKVAEDDILGVKSDLIDEYLAGLNIRPELETRMVIVSYTSPDPVLAAKLSNAHVKAYIQQGYELRTRSNETALRFLQGQLGQLEKRLEKSEAALNDYRRERGILAFALDDKDRLVSERISALNKDFVDAEEARIALQAQIETIKSDNYEAVPAVVNNGLIQGLKAELSRLRGQYANLSTQYTPDYPDVAQLHAQILQVQQREEQEIGRVVNSIQVRYKAAIDRETELGKELEGEKARAMSLNDASLRDAVLAREVGTNRALYRNVLERIKVLGVASAAQLTNVSVIDPAVMQQFPTSPKKKLSLVLAGFFALVIGISVTFFLEMRDKGLKTADEAEQYLRLPNLATVFCFSSMSAIKLARNRLLETRRLWSESDGKYAGTLKLIADGRSFTELKTANPQGNETTPQQASFSAAGEAYRAIRARILLSRSERPPKTVLFTSAISGEGKTVTVINTAVAFASLLDRVLLIDADLRRGRGHEIMNCNASPGLTEVLSGISALEDAIQTTHVKGLFLLGAGELSPNPSELLGSSKMKEVLARVGSMYEYILIDSAPVLPVSDSVLLSTLVDGVVVIAARLTARQAIRLGCTRLGSVGARIIGTVLNCVNIEHQPHYARYAQYYVGSTGIQIKTQDSVIRTNG
jgi:succinoglycan biosynthesis transport protein ExoP